MIWFKRQTFLTRKNRILETVWSFCQ